jgi:hypothetical protein|eukprot:COSAG01_NODE_1239_length_11087_cov_7.928376_9_plen_233_part_00
MDEEEWDDLECDGDGAAAREDGEEAVTSDLAAVDSSRVGEAAGDTATMSADTAASGQRSRKARRNELLTQQQLLTWKEAMIGEVANLLSVTRIVAKRLLAHYSWDNALIKTAVCEEWFEGKRAAVLARIGEGWEGGSALARSMSGAVATTECTVCFDECSPADISWSRCGHCFCNSCWGMHLQQQITDGNVGERHAQFVIRQWQAVDRTWHETTQRECKLIAAVWWWMLQAR